MLSQTKELDLNLHRRENFKSHNVVTFVTLYSWSSLYCREIMEASRLQWGEKLFPTHVIIWRHSVHIHYSMGQDAEYGNYVEVVAIFEFYKI